MSLIEVMIAIVLLMIVSMALMQTSLVGYQTNIQNALREEATRVADEEMSKQRDTAYAALVTLPTTTVSRNFRGFTEVYSITPTVAEFAAVNSKQINVFVEWEYRGKRYNHSITTIVGKP
jgi:type IV pilus assembly protein PilV